MNQSKYSDIYTLQWLIKYLNHEEFSNVRFKLLDQLYHSFKLDRELLDFVDMEDFSLIEQDRIPLFFGTQFGLFPGVNKIHDFFNGTKLVSVLSMSLMSGMVVGLSIYKIDESMKMFHPGGPEFNKINWFKN